MQGHRPAIREYAMFASKLCAAVNYRLPIHDERHTDTNETLLIMKKGMLLGRSSFKKINDFSASTYQYNLYIISFFARFIIIGRILLDIHVQSRKTLN